MTMTTPERAASTSPLADLSVCYSSLRERVGRIDPPRDPAVEVVVLVQGPGPVPDVPGARTVRLGSLGVARSRNAALDVAGRRYLLFCDDDVEVDLDGVAAGIERLRRTGAAIALGRGTSPDRTLRKRYSPDGTPLTLLNSAKAATYELLVDVEQVRAHGVRFDHRFGAGAQYYLGDEYVFIADALRAGLRGVAVAEVFGTHPATSSGSRWGTEADRAVRAVVLNRVFGRHALPARVAFAARRLPRLGPRAALRFALDGRRPLGSPDAPVPDPGLPTHDTRPEERHR
ncbi:glycosyltransferase [Phycicoccus sp. BSK3Z-2]|uniref:Glycosyltransferase n=1 Tax=Phycicoccus avicenniae TaxID=2828860 RepID=A0A941D791_9MICO|nr:glycosyltransferase [Phycicoccus avicenniae]MBR7742080.1 glycosyltransferase [Phycicoccus avicenniae]